MGQKSLTPNIMHCHLVSCMRDFGLMYSFWLFPFKRYNGILGKQPTNNRSVELQFMRRFHKDNACIQLATDAQNWPLSESFISLLGDPIAMDNSLKDNASNNILGNKYMISSLSGDFLQVLKQLYSKIYVEFSNEILTGKILVSSTFRRYT